MPPSECGTFLAWQAGLDLAEMLQPAPAEPDEGAAGGADEAARSSADGADDGAGGGGAIEWDRFEGPKQLLNPATLNMHALLTRLLPGASALGSAHALAQFYAAVGAGRLLPASLLAQAQATTAAGTDITGEKVRFGLGFQLGACTETAVRGIELDLTHRTKTHAALGHAAVGGTIGFCVPEKRVALAITVSKLASARPATRRLLDLLMAEVGLSPPAGM